MGKSGKKSKRGEADNRWGEAKQNFKLTLTPAAIAALKRRKETQQFDSVSELVEQFARELLPEFSPSIAQLCQLIDLKTCGDAVDLKPERLQEIANGACPTDAELVEIRTALGEPWRTCKLYEIRYRDFKVPKPEVKTNGS